MLFLQLCFVASDWLVWKSGSYLQLVVNLLEFPGEEPQCVADRKHFLRWSLRDLWRNKSVWVWTVMFLTESSSRYISSFCCVTLGSAAVTSHSNHPSADGCTAEVLILDKCKTPGGRASLSSLFWYEWRDDANKQSSWCLYSSTHTHTHTVVFMTYWTMACPLVSPISFL